MPKLTQEEARVLVSIRRLLLLARGYFPASSPSPGTAFLQLILKEMKRMSDTFDTELAQLRSDVTAQSTVIASATAAFQGLAAQLAAAETAAKNAGASDTQISSVAAVRQSLESNTAALAAAIPANTPAASPDAAAAPAPTQG
jgi:hypothetical protein